MPKKISEKLEEIHDFIKSDPDGAGRVLANELSHLAGNAIRSGMASRAWEAYMVNFTDPPGNADQLKRLIGEDLEFNQTEWGLESLAYIAANSTCDVATTTGTKNNMSQEMIDNLDA